VREAAREALMGLSADRGLPQLLAVVRAAGPLRPDQAAALPEIVRQLRLTDEPYDMALGGNDDETRYILGQDWPGVPRGQDRLGVPVVHRWPGFPSRRLLRDGDLILGLYNDPAAPPDRPPDVPTHQVEDLVEGMRACPTRPLLAMLVLRDGRTIRVTGTMVVEPLATAGRRPGAVAGFLADRQRVADDYWQEQFAPLLDPAPPTTEPADIDGIGP
jgi:hypothetical protein